MSADAIYIKTIIAGIVMVGAYAVGKFLKFSTELCMFVAVIGGAIAGEQDLILSGILPKDR